MKNRTASATLIVPMMLALSAGLAAPVQAQVQWQATDAPAFMPEKDAVAVFARVAKAGASHVVVQLSRVPTEGDRAALAGAGLRLGAPVGGMAFFAGIDTAKLDAAAIRNSGLVTGAQEINAGWKIHPRLAARDLSGMVTHGTAKAAGNVDPIVALCVLLHADVANDAAAAAEASAAASPSLDAPAWKRGVSS